jgi:multidrug efflux pump subunit AcrB
VLALTLWSSRYDNYTLRRIAAQIEGEIKNIDDVSLTQIIGGQKRRIRVLLDPGRWLASGWRQRP